jgi:chromosome segregation ATPase
VESKSLNHRLNRIRNLLLANARRCEANRELIVRHADTIEETIDHLELLEKCMRSKQQAVDALIELAKTQKQQIATLTAQLAAAPKPEDVVTDAEVLAINELAPEPVTPAPGDGQPA